MFRRLAQTILTFKWPIFLGLILLTLFMANAVLRLPIDPSTDSLFVKNSEDYKSYRAFSETFGSDHMIAVAMADPNLFSMESLMELKWLTEKIAAYSQVERVLSLANAVDIKHKFFWRVKIVPALGDVFKGKQSPENARQGILENELYRNNLVSKDGKVANIVIFLKPLENKSSEGFFIEELRELLRLHAIAGRKFYVAGSPVEQYDFIRFIRRDQMIFVPVIAIFLIIATWLLFRSFPCMVLAMSIVFMTLIWTLGTITLAGRELNLVTSLLAPVIMIIAIVNAVHLMTLFFSVRLQHLTLENAVLLTLSQAGIPCFLSHFTTILGFLSLLFSPVPAIQSFGTFAAIGTLYSYMVSMLLTLILIPFLPYKKGVESDRSKNFFKKYAVNLLENLEVHWKGWIITGSILALVFSLIGISRLEVDTNLIKQMKPDTPLAVSTRFIDNHLTGVYVLGFILTPKDGSTLANYKALERIDRFKDFLESMPEIAKVNSITTLIKKINQARYGKTKAYNIPNKPKRLEKYFEGLIDSGDPELWKLLTPDLKQTRLEARMRSVGTTQGALVEKAVRQYMDQELKDYFEYHLTGNVVLLGQISKDLVYNQVKGFLFAFTAILISICLIFRSLKMGLLSSFPNILPILIVYGLMGFAAIELSSPTAMIASIVLGMVVDASIHFLYRFRREFSNCRSYSQSLHRTYRRIGQSLSVSTLILVIGFSSSVFASFRPTIYFGILTSLAILFSFVSSMVILPLLLVMLKPFGRERLVHRTTKIEPPTYAYAI